TSAAALAWHRVLGMNPFELILVLLFAVAALAALARRIGVAYPILLVLGGLALGFVPELPYVEIDPDTVFLLFVPPLVYAAAVVTPLREFRANLRPILFLAIGLVLVTVVRAAVEGFTWGAAFVLATVVAPTDAVAVTAITDRLRVPRRVVTILEGESLANGATALGAYRLGITAVLTGRVSIVGAGLRVGWGRVRRGGRGLG